MAHQFKWGWVFATLVPISGLWAQPASPSSVQTTTVPASIEAQAADLAMRGTMKSHFRKGMSCFLKRKYDQAVPELMAATMIVDPLTWNYWYAEAYATLGVIYEFYRPEPDRDLRAYRYYSLALKRDPHTKTALYFIDRVRPTHADPSQPVISQ